MTLEVDVGVLLKAAAVVVQCSCHGNRLKVSGGWQREDGGRLREGKKRNDRPVIPGVQGRSH